MASRKKEEKPEIHICYLCNKEIDPEDKFEFIQTKRKTKLYIHAAFLRQDLQQLALDLDVPVPDIIYGTIECRADGTLYTTGAQRTGCSMCGFGVHMEKRPHRFDQLRERNPKEWEFWMYRCCTDPDTGEKFGWGRVLDYIGVGWKDIPAETQLCGQMSFEDFPEVMP